MTEKDLTIREFQGSPDKNFFCFVKECKKHLEIITEHSSLGLENVVTCPIINKSICLDFMGACTISKSECPNHE